MAKYLIRIDDIHPKMNYQNFLLLEKLFDKYDIKPTIAVIPENKDQSICSRNSKSIKNFWKKIHLLYSKGWNVSAHGLNHTLSNVPENLSIIKHAVKSEFINKKLKQQIQIIKSSLDIFNKNNIKITSYTFPAHSFNFDSLSALKKNNINIVYDGLFFRPVIIKNILFVPQQLWRPRLVPFGTWTICLHPNNLKKSDIENLSKFISKNYKNFITFNDIFELKINKVNLVDMLFSYLFALLIKFKRKLKKNKLVEC